MKTKENSPNCPRLAVAGRPGDVPLIEREVPRARWGVSLDRESSPWQGRVLSAFGLSPSPQGDLEAIMSRTLIRPALTGCILLTCVHGLGAREGRVSPVLTARPVQASRLVSATSNDPAPIRTQAPMTLPAEAPAPVAGSMTAQHSSSTAAAAGVIDGSCSQCGTSGCGSDRPYDPRTCGHKKRATHPICDPCQYQQFGYVPTCWSLWPQPLSYDHCCPHPIVPQLPQQMISQYGSPFPKPAETKPPATPPQGEGQPKEKSEKPADELKKTKPEGR